jgi:hypothetical protein
VPVICAQLLILSHVVSLRVHVNTSPVHGQRWFLDGMLLCFSVMERSAMRLQRLLTNLVAVWPEIHAAHSLVTRFSRTATNQTRMIGSVKATHVIGRGTKIHAASQGLDVWTNQLPNRRAVLAML